MIYIIAVVLVIAFGFKILTLPFRIIGTILNSGLNSGGKAVIIILSIAACFVVGPIGIIAGIVLWIILYAINR